MTVRGVSYPELDVGVREWTVIPFFHLQDYEGASLCIVAVSLHGREAYFGHYFAELLLLVHGAECAVESEPGE